MGIIMWVIVGLIAGFIASRIIKTSHGLIMYLVIGLIGSVIGGYMASVFNLNIGGGVIDQLVISTVGAIVLLFIWQAVRKS